LYPWPFPDFEPTPHRVPLLPDRPLRSRFSSWLESSHLDCNITALMLLRISRRPMVPCSLFPLSCPVFLLEARTLNKPPEFGFLISDDVFLPSTSPRMKVLPRITAADPGYPARVLAPQGSSFRLDESFRLFAPSFCFPFHRPERRAAREPMTPRRDSFLAPRFFLLSTPVSGEFHPSSQSG